MWDVFISYKSQNVEIARAITNRLLASGLKVWFAEYQILLTARERFQEAIDQGIRESAFGIALTNDAYAGSIYCELEMQQLLQFCGPENILEIMIPAEPLTHQKYDRLADAHQHLFNGDLEETLQFISRQTGWRILPAPLQAAAPEAEIFTGDCLKSPYRLDVSGWIMRERSFYGGGPCYSRQVNGNEIYWNLQYGEEYSPQVYESRASLAHQNDRELYNMLVDYARPYFSDLQSNSRVHGVHLFFFNGSSHIALTYSDGSIWKRRVSLMLLHPVSGRAAEFLFTFEFVGSFEQYCLHSQVMDDLVQSLRWGEGAETGQMAPGAPSTKAERLSRVIEDQPRANQLSAQGLDFAKQGRLQEAIAAWQQVLDYSTLAELRGQVLFNLGRAHEKLGDEESALTCYQQSAEENPAQFNALCNIGSIYHRRGAYEQALPYLLSAAQGNPRDEITLRNLVICYEALGRNTEADQARAALF